ncbi:MAG TPA: ATP-dependent helicase, partial [Firmicutes bacterium]|nr:ATP-dependent helicase [Bacillota bacterium]
MLLESFEKVRGAVFFSGTFSPIGYFIESILGLENVPYLLLPSPFPKENFKLLLAPLISLRLKDRDKTIQEVASFLQSFVQSKIGNFFIYLPSFLYLSKIKPLLSFGEEVDIYYQTESMDSEKKSEFLSHFQENPKKTTVGILVIGGSFGEGVDLPFDRLIGVAIVGTGMPQIGFENELLKSRFKEKGFDYAYRNPGINKVMQAVGRLIRSEKDKGI